MIGEPNTNAAMAKVLDRAAYNHGLEPALVRGLAFVESRWNPKAISDKGAKGICQLMPAVCADHGVTDPFNAAENARAGCAHLARLIRKFGSVQLGLCAYNWGPRNVQERLDASGQIPPAVQLYATRVLERAKLEMLHPTCPFADRGEV